MKVKYEEVGSLRHVLCHVLEAYLTTDQFREVQACSFREDVFYRMSDMSPYRDHGLEPKNLQKLAEDVREGMGVRSTPEFKGALYRLLDDSKVTYGDILDFFHSWLEEEATV